MFRVGLLPDAAGGSPLLNLKDVSIEEFCGSAGPAGLHVNRKCRELYRRASYLLDPVSRSLPVAPAVCAVPEST
jgi:hypothetical protein